jgi:transportin-1
LGDLTISAFGYVKPSLEAIIPLMIMQISNNKDAEISVCNNAVWAAGEMALQLGHEVKPFIEHLMPRLMDILNGPTLFRLKTLHENAAITIGRLGLVCPNEIASSLPHFINLWCRALREIRDNMEKDTAFRGLCRMIAVNPQGVFKDLAFVCDAILRWNEPSQSLLEEFRAVSDQIISPP